MGKTNNFFYVLEVLLIFIIISLIIKAFTIVGSFFHETSSGIAVMGCFVFLSVLLLKAISFFLIRRES